MSAAGGRISAARSRQLERQGGANATLPPDQLASSCLLGKSEKSALEQAAQRLHLSGRGLHRSLRVARTIADLEGASRVGGEHLAEALTFRRDYGA